MNQKIYLGDMPEQIRDEVKILCDLGVGLEDIEYLINIRRREYANFY